MQLNRTAVAFEKTQRKKFLKLMEKFRCLKKQIHNFFLNTKKYNEPNVSTFDTKPTKTRRTVGYTTQLN